MKTLACLTALLTLGCQTISEPPLAGRGEPLGGSCSYGVARWGAGDEAGQSNTQTPVKMAEAAFRFITPASKTFVLAHPLEPNIPTLPFPGLVGYQFQVPNDGFHVLGLFDLVGHEELVTAEIGQVGTQIDALGHMCFLDNPFGDPLGAARCYGGFTEAQIYDPAQPQKGLQKLGAEKLKPYFTVGHLIDLTLVNGGQRLAPGTPVMMAMVLAAMDAEGLDPSEVREGDVVLFRTGHEELWAGGETGGYYGAAPGITLEVAQFFAERCVGNLGGDTGMLEVSPPVDPTGAVPVHEFNLLHAGIPQRESLKLAALAAHIASRPPGLRSYSFAYIDVPVPYRGASGSSGAPLAITRF